MKAYRMKIHVLLLLLLMCFSRNNCVLTGNGSPSSGRQLGRCGSGRYCLSACMPYWKWKPLIWASARAGWKWKGRGGSGRGLPNLPDQLHDQFSSDKKYQPSTAQAHLILPTVEHQNIVGPNLDDVRPSPMRIGHRPISFEIE